MKDKVSPKAVLLKKAVRSEGREQLLLWQDGRTMRIVQRVWDNYRLRRIVEGCQTIKTTCYQEVLERFLQRVKREGWELVAI